MDLNDIKAVYFIGIGGIGMSALVRYFLSKGKKVGGYDRTPSELTAFSFRERYRLEDMTTLRRCLRKDLKLKVRI